MVELYTQKLLSNKVRALKRLTAVLVVSAAMVLCACVVPCFFVTDRNATALQATVTVLAILSGWALIYLLSGVIIPLCKEKSHVAKILFSDKREVSGKVVECNKPLTLYGNVYSTVIKLDKGDFILELRWNRMFGSHPFNVGDDAIIETVDNFICGYEVLK